MVLCIVCNALYGIIFVFPYRKHILSYIIHRKKNICVILKYFSPPLNGFNSKFYPENIPIPFSIQCILDKFSRNMSTQYKSNRIKLH